MRVCEREIEREREKRERERTTEEEAFGEGEKKRDSENFHSSHRRRHHRRLFCRHRRCPTSPAALRARIVHAMISNTFSSRPTAALGSNSSGSTLRAVPCRRPTIGGKLSTSTSTSTSKASSSVRPPSLSSSPAARAVAPPRALSRPFDPPSAPVTADSDPELLEVLEMCDDAELESVWGLLTGASPFFEEEKNV